MSCLHLPGVVCDNCAPYRLTPPPFQRPEFITYTTPDLPKVSSTVTINLQERSAGEKKAYGDGYLAGLDYAINKLDGEGDVDAVATLTILRTFREGLEAIHRAG